ncbi:MAG: KamA family radical SAM protein [Bacillota bacterium]
MNRLDGNVKTIRELSEYIPMDPDTVCKLEELAKRFPISIPRYYLSLIDPADSNDPIRRMCVPSLEEYESDGLWDTSGEISNTVMEGLQHKYPQTVLILSTNQCAMYCRHCFRKRMVGLSDDEIIKNFEPMLNYIKEHKQINNVLISGGDALLNSNRIIRFYIEQLSQIGHLDFIRIGTRIPVTYPALITQDAELLDILKSYASKIKIYISTQFNHPKEVTPESLASIRSLLDCGIIISNQAVLLNRVNDDPDTIAALMNSLTKVGIIPYYIFQCRPVSHVKTSFQVPLLRGYEIIEKAKTQCNGYGKRFRYAMSHERGKIEIVGKLNEKDTIFKFHQAKYEADNGKIFTARLKEDQTWLDMDLT